MAEKKELLSSLINKHSINENISNDLISLFEEKVYKKNETLLCQGELWNKVFFVKKGIIRLYFVTLDGQEFNKNFFAENSLICPIIPLLKEKDSLFYIDALESSEVLSAEFNSFEQKLKDYNILESFSLPICEILVSDKITREYSFLVNSAKDRYLDFLEKNKSIITRIPDYHLASYLGMTSVSLSRIKKQLKN